MKRVNKLVFEKSITRDWGIIYAEVWHDVFTKDFKEQLGWGYTEVVFEGQNDVISVYRAPQEHLQGMRDFILRELDANPDWLAQHAMIVKGLYISLVDWVKKIKQKSLDQYDNQELAQILRSFLQKNRELSPRFIMMLWFPIQMEAYDKADTYQTATAVAVEARSQIEKVGPLVDSFAREIARETARRAGISATLDRYITSQEILDFLERDVSLNPKLLQQRQHYFLVTSEGTLDESVTSYLQRQGYELHQEQSNASLEIKGRTAYAGIVRGVVKIVRGKEMFVNVKKGDIVVASMTTPDFLPILKLAAGFITDEGGITCHAAIVARELKKPCVIGAKIATQVLKDGDTVEVDADQEVVRILKRG